MLQVSLIASNGFTAAFLALILSLAKEDGLIKRIFVADLEGGNQAVIENED